MTTNIYVLNLEGGFYYVGRTNDLTKRFEQHRTGTGKGATWTKIHKVISYDKVIENASPLDEDKITKEYMAKYGIDNVRGGSYVSIELSEFHRTAIQEEIWNAKGLCSNHIPRRF